MEREHARSATTNWTLLLSTGAAVSSRHRIESLEPRSGLRVDRGRGFMAHNVTMTQTLLNYEFQ